MLLMHPEMQFGRIVFSTFFPRATFHTAWTRNGPRPAGPKFKKYARASGVESSILVVLASVHRYSRPMVPFDNPFAFKTTRLAVLRRERRGAGVDLHVQTRFGDVARSSREGFSK
jgi:hypothetical protein